MAIAAAGALVLSGCTSDTGEDDPTTPPAAGEDGETPTDDGEGAGGDVESPSDPGMTEDPGATATEGGEGEYTGKPDIGEVTTQEGNIYYAVGQDEWSGYNGSLSSTNSVYNAVINARLSSGFWYFGTDGTIYPDETFGSYTKTSDDPLTVEYTISDEAVWEDGTPITYDDYLYYWASTNPEVLFPPAEGEEAAEPVFDNVDNSAGLYVPEGPVGEPGGKTFTVVYPEPYPDWQLVFGGVFPAHIAAEQSGLTLEEVTTAILERDADTVAQTAEFWNTGWLSPDKVLPDPSIVPSSGPYSLDPANGATWEAGQFLTLGPNPQYWGPPPATSNLTFRFTAPENMVQALQNGDLTIIEPQATVDTVQQIQGMGDQFTLLTANELTWEHTDFNFAEGSAFSEEQGGLAAREAFAHCLPRQRIVDNLIKPINPDAVVMNLREAFPFQEEKYNELVEAAYDGRYDEVDLEAAQAKFGESGLEEGVEIRIGYSAPNQRRTDEVALIKSSCDQVGFNIVDAGDPNFFQEGGALEVGDFEIALFGWAGSGQIASGEQIYVTGGTQNFGKYSNETVDAAWGELVRSVDPAVHMEQLKVIEKQLWDDLATIPIFPFPGVVAHDARMENVIFNASQTQIPWNAEQWRLAQ